MYFLGPAGLGGEGRERAAAVFSVAMLWRGLAWIVSSAYIKVLLPSGWPWWRGEEEQCLRCLQISSSSSVGWWYADITPHAGSYILWSSQAASAVHRCYQWRMEPLLARLRWKPKLLPPGWAVTEDLHRPRQGIHGWRHPKWHVPR
jgi:hypothetical protein